jgi:hypothetical protein
MSLNGSHVYGASIDEYVQVDAIIVCPIDHNDHELEVVAAFLIDVGGPPLLFARS